MLGVTVTVTGRSVFLDVNHVRFPIVCTICSTLPTVASTVAAPRCQSSHNK